MVIPPTTSPAQAFWLRVVYLTFAQAWLITSFFRDGGDQFVMVLGGVAWTIAGVAAGRRKSG